VTSDLDDNITVELRDKSDTNILESKNIVETREEEGTVSTGTRVSYKRTQRNILFRGEGRWRISTCVRHLQEWRSSTSSDIPHEVLTQEPQTLRFDLHGGTGQSEGAFSCCEIAIPLSTQNAERREIAPNPGIEAGGQRC
jgi:hypothetical protein